MASFSSASSTSSDSTCVSALDAFDIPNQLKESKDWKTVGELKAPSGKIYDVQIISYSLTENDEVSVTRLPDDLDEEMLHEITGYVKKALEAYKSTVDSFDESKLSSSLFYYDKLQFLHNRNIKDEKDDTLSAENDRGILEAFYMIRLTLSPQERILIKPAIEEAPKKKKEPLKLNI